MHKKTSVLVTGGAGFIGNHLVDRLVNSGYNVRVMDNLSTGKLTNIQEHIENGTVDFVEGDIKDLEQVKNCVHGVDAVLHLAAVTSVSFSVKNPTLTYETNAAGTLNLLVSLAKERVGKFVFISSCAVYGEPQYLPIDELHPIVGQSPYSATKIAADKLVESFWNSFDLPACIIRPFNTYGPRQSARAIIPTIITQALSGKKLKLGNLDPVRDLTFVVDTAHGFIAASKAPAVLSEVVNLGTGEGFSVYEVVQHIMTLLGKEIVIEEDQSRIRPAKSEVMRLISNNTKATTLMGWSPRFDLKTGLQMTIEYMQNHLSDYKHTIYNI